ncbi:MAG: phosphatidic acid phosphatase, partial [Bacteroidota bacterium]
MELLAKTFKPFVLCTLGMIAMLIKPCIGYGQMISSTYNPFKFELADSISPLNKELLSDEVEEIISVQKETDEAGLWSIKYWNGAYPSYRWHQLLMEVGKRHNGHKNGGRVAIMHLSIYDAMVEVWKHKKAHYQKAVYEYDARVKKLGPKPEFSTFICDWSAAAGAAHSVIHYYFPEQKDVLDSNLTAFKSARLATGLQFLSDIENGLEIGQKIAEKYIEYAKGDRTAFRWDGNVPKSDSLWSGNPGPWDPMKKQWKPLTLIRANQFRPGPPPTDWSLDMEELRQFNAANQTSEIAWKWKSEPIWDRLIERKILEFNLNP